MARTARQDKVRELQRTLYRAAKADPGRRFHALYDKLYRRDVLERAWGLVRANRGAAGIDRQTIAAVEAYGIAKLLDELAADLKEGRWRPLPARRVFIPKPGRPTEQRPLSIPTVIAYHKVVQAAFGFAGGHTSLPSAARRASSGAVRPSGWCQSYLRVRGRAAGQRGVARGRDRSWPGARRAAVEHRGPGRAGRAGRRSHRRAGGGAMIAASLDCLLHGG